MKEKNISDYHKELFDHFGYNYGFVADLLEKYFEDPTSLSEYWQNYFGNLTAGNGEAAKQVKQNSTPRKATIKKEKPVASSFEISDDDEAQLVTGISAKIIENMDNSLTMPTATSLRTISVKLLSENRRIINQHLKRMTGGKVSFSALVAFALVQATREYPNVNNSFAVISGNPNIIKKKHINLGIAVDTVRKDGTRILIVPNIKKADKLNFSEFVDAYNQLVFKAKNNKIEPSDFQGTTLTLTNPGGIGTVSSNPRLMTGQGAIIAVGAIDYPAEFKAMHDTALANFGVGKVMNITSTYDHRIIQGAESGEFLKKIDELLLGGDSFYDKIFEDLYIPQKPVGWGLDTSTRREGMIRDRERIEKQAKILQLINIYRVRGHLIANLNPLSNEAQYHEELDPSNYDLTIWDYDRYFISNIQGLETGSLREILDILHQTYCEKIGVEYMHIQSHKEKLWLQEQMEPVRNTPNYSEVQKKRILEKLIIAEGFEHFLHTRFIGHKRFSLEGSETVIPLLDHLLELASSENFDEVFLGMAHRGRLNVLSNIIGKSYEKIFSEFEEDIDPESPQGTGDVKYHLGASGEYDTLGGKKIKVSVASNPSHLEWVNPVVEGIVRAKQRRKKDRTFSTTLPVLIHGDAAFAGQGVVAETLNLSQLKGYRTGGTIHVIINNQIGFTTAPEDARSSPYATDVAKMVQAPIFHVNGDDPESSLWITELAYHYRNTFHKDVVIDLFGYRRHGHNEGDDPVYTQPLMYKEIKAHPSVREIYESKMVDQGHISKDDAEKLNKAIYDKLDKALKSSKRSKQTFVPDRPFALNEEVLKDQVKKSETKVPIETLSQVVRGLTTFPDKFTLNPKLKKHNAKRKELLTGNARIDWAFGEALAFGTLLMEGFPVRLSGQDSARGTFSQRHLIMTDMNTGEDFVPHNNITEDQAYIEPLDSLLSEAAVMGFEYGYSVADPYTLTMWEAQFGDFANSAQVIIDNFIAPGGTKWQVPSNLILLLPHAQEGQGPEHSSARIERYLELSAANNWYVAYPTTPAQYFHLLRRQIHDEFEIPAVVFTPKSLLRLPDARSPINEFTEGKYQEIIDDDSITNRKSVKKVVLTSGKIYYDLVKYRNANGIEDFPIVRVEQYYPFNDDLLLNILKQYPNARTINWVQEEPENMGAWRFIQAHLLNILPKSKRVKYIGREASPSPAAGSTKLYLATQDKLLKQAFK